MSVPFPPRCKVSTPKRSPSSCPPREVSPSFSNGHFFSKYVLPPYRNIREIWVRDRVAPKQIRHLLASETQSVCSSCPTPLTAVCGYLRSISVTYHQDEKIWFALKAVTEPSSEPREPLPKPRYSFKQILRRCGTTYAARLTRKALTIEGGSRHRIDENHLMS